MNENCLNVKQKEPISQLKVNISFFSFGEH